MFEPLGTPTFLAAARGEGKKFPPAKVFLLFLVVYLIGSFLQSTVLTPFLFVTMLSDPAYYELTNQAITGTDYTAFVEQLNAYTASLTQKPLVMAGALFATVGTTAACLVFCKFIEKRSLFSMGLTKKGAVPAYLRGCLFGLALFAGAIGFSYLFGGWHFTGVNQSFSFLLCLLLFVGYLLQGFSEEILCRGFLMVSLGSTARLPFALTVSAVTFAVLHVGNTGFALLPFINLVLFGFLMGLYMIRGGSIWGAAALHSIWNFAEGVLGSFSVSGMKMPTSLLLFSATEGKEIFTGGAFGPEGGLGVTFALAVALALLAMAKTKSPSVPPHIPTEK